jgi:DNA-binding CsgD family transcriptional regulator
MARRKITDEQIDRLIEMREHGASNERIAAEFNVSVSAVRWQCLKHAAEAPGRKQRPIVPKRVVVIQRGSHQVRRFTVDEDAKLRELEALGLSNAEIGRRLRRKPHSILGRLMTLARHEARAEGAQT